MLRRVRRWGPTFGGDWTSWKVLAVAKQKEQHRNRRRKRKPLKRAVSLLLLLWLFTLLFFGAAFVDLYDEIGALRATNASMVSQILALQSELGHTASRSDVEALANDLAHLRQSYEQAVADQSARQLGSQAMVGLAADPLPHSDPAYEPASAGSDLKPDEPWYRTVADRASFYGGQLLSALAEALRPRPMFP